MKKADENLPFLFIRLSEWFTIKRRAVGILKGNRETDYRLYAKHSKTAVPAERPWQAI